MRTDVNSHVRSEPRRASKLGAWFQIVKKASWTAAGSQEALAELYDRYGRLALIRLRSACSAIRGVPKTHREIAEMTSDSASRSSAHIYTEGAWLMSEHEELESSVAAWVLGAVEADDVDVLRTHIEACPTCRETALRLGRTVSALPLDVEEIIPPKRLRERILAAAAAASCGSAVAPSALPPPPRNVGGCRGRGLYQGVLET